MRIRSLPVRAAAACASTRRRQLPRTHGSSPKRKRALRPFRGRSVDRAAPRPTERRLYLRNNPRIGDAGDLKRSGPGVGEILDRKVHHLLWRISDVLWDCASADHARDEFGGGDLPGIQLPASHHPVMVVRVDRPLENAPHEGVHQLVRGKELARRQGTAGLAAERHARDQTIHVKRRHRSRQSVAPKRRTFPRATCHGQRSLWPSGSVTEPGAGWRRCDGPRKDVSPA